MWLLPAFWVARTAGRVYYRLTISGRPIPKSGPLLLVANHPNSLLDPVLVMAAARREVRFLAKAPLFTDPMIGWLVKGTGAIPVYRRTDDPDQMDKNATMFNAAHAALADGAAIGIFPEGRSHSEPSIAPLKTGAARIALGAAGRVVEPFPIIPIGLVLRHKATFRSEAIVLAGDPIPWTDLADRRAEDADAVRDLTERIEAGLRRVTVNLDQWEDRPIVERSLEIWEAEFGTDAEPTTRLRRLEVTTSLLREIRAQPRHGEADLLPAVRSFGDRMRRLRLKSSDLTRDLRTTTAVKWSVQRLVLVSLPALTIALTTYGYYFIPFRLTGRIAAALGPDHDQLSTYKLLVGIPIYALWVAGTAAVVAVTIHWIAAVIVLLGAPVLGITGLGVRERWRGALRDARRFLLLRSRRTLVAELLARRQDLARRLDAVYRDRTSHPTPA